MPLAPEDNGVGNRPASGALPRPTPPIAGGSAVYTGRTVLLSNASPTLKCTERFARTSPRKKNRRRFQTPDAPSRDENGQRTEALRAGVGVLGAGVGRPAHVTPPRPGSRPHSDELGHGKFRGRPAGPAGPAGALWGTLGTLAPRPCLLAAKPRRASRGQQGSAAFGPRRAKRNMKPSSHFI